jgi:hypothetical protein
MEFTRICGMEVAWATGSAIPSWGYLLDFDTTIPWEIRAAALNASESRVPFIPYRSGSWFRTLAAVRDAGGRRAVVTLSRRRDPTHSPLRTAIVIAEVRWAFVPIYKSGYSSFREFCFEQFSEFSGLPRGDSAALNTEIDPRSLAREYETFSFSRDPLSRFRSFYKDKMLRAKGSDNDRLFAQPISNLAGGHRILDVARFVSAVPDSHSDPHWRSQYSTLYYDSAPLVQKIFALDHASRAVEALWPREPAPPFPQVLVTTGLDESVDQEWAAAEPLVRKRYERDFEIFETALRPR